MRVVTFGEIMGRLSPPGFLRLRQALPGQLDVTFAGAEANVAASLAMLGREATFVTALPKNLVADACVASLAAMGVDTRRIIRTDVGRLGLYFVEAGANQRPSQVVYDRAGSSISLAETNAFDWPNILQDAGWLHVTGITPSLSSNAAENTLQAVQAARQLGLHVSCDLNFRKKLWNWSSGTPARELAEQTMRRILPFVDLVVANEEDCADVLSIRAADTNVESGELSIDRYPDVARTVVEQFPNISRVAITLRESVSASHNNWGAMLFERDGEQAHFAPVVDGKYQPYEIRNIVDRVGAGDSFAAGLIYSLTSDDLADADLAVRFATASSCLAHSILGDCNFSSLSEVRSLMAGSTSGRVIR